MRVLNDAQPCLFNLLNGAIREDAFFLSICKQTLDCAVWEANLFRTIWEVLLDLIVLEFEYLKPVRERCLSCLCL